MAASNGVLLGRSIRDDDQEPASQNPGGGDASQAAKREPMTRAGRPDRDKSRERDFTPIEKRFVLTAHQLKQIADGLECTIEDAVLAIEIDFIVSASTDRRLRRIRL